jgi:2-polyprenyl-6-methoxyphenol hydroxylase-like FAD-dependent oxidoreductase
LERLASPLARAWLARMSSVSAVVVGCGPGGLAAAAALARRGARVCLVGPVDEGSAAHVGLWPPGLRALGATGVSVGALEAVGAYMPSSGYRSWTGSWLARASRLRACAASGILFVRERDLLAAQVAALPQGVERVASRVTDVEVLRGGGGGGARVRLNDGCTLSADVVVGADGRSSVVADTLTLALAPHTLASPSSSSSSSWSSSWSWSWPTSTWPPPPRLAYRGFRVFRAESHGVALAAAGEAFAFQSWGAGLRFAQVPTGPSSQVWFAALSGPQRHGAPRAAEPASASELAELHARLGAWPRRADHPVHAVVERAESATVEDAWAMPASRFARSAAPLLLIGDAAHTLDPILALGVSVAADDAVQLSAALLPAGAARPDWAAAARVAAARDVHVRQLAALGLAAQALGETALTGPRDWLLRAVPAPLKTIAFDALLGSRLLGIQ